MSQALVWFFGASCWWQLTQSLPLAVVWQTAQLSIVFDVRVLPWDLGQSAVWLAGFSLPMEESVWQTAQSPALPTCLAV